VNKRMKKKQQNYISEDSMTKESSIRTKLSKFNKKWILVIVNVVVLVGVIVFVKTSYAYLYETLRGQKSYSLKVKGFSLKLDDSSTSENIKIENSIPVSDEEGKVGNAYTFSIINEDPSETGYVLYLDDVEIDNEINRMKDTVVKYQLIENGKEQVGLVSELGTHPFRILTSGVTSMTSDELQTYVDRALGNKLDQKEKEILDKNHPVGSIYITETNKNPAELFGGKWEQYASGKTLVGLDSTNTGFNTVGKTGGANKVTLNVRNLPNHVHTTAETVTSNLNLKTEQSTNNTQFANYNGYPLYSQKSQSTGDQYGIDFSYGYGQDYPFKIKGSSAYTWYYG